jgi:hypothetical protein
MSVMGSQGEKPNGPGYPEPLKVYVVQHSIQEQCRLAIAYLSSYGEIISMFSPRVSFNSDLLTEENGPDGIRTRICKSLQSALSFLTMQFGPVV